MAARLATLVALVALAAFFTFWNERRVDGAGADLHVIDGDSLRIRGEEIRLAGIDAPELAQTCEREGRSWRCGQAARAALEREARRGRLACAGSKTDRYGRLLAICKADGAEINAAMVRTGLAVAYGKYEREEAEARDARKGIWAGAFKRPEEWRSEHPRPARTAH